MSWWQRRLDWYQKKMNDSDLALDAIFGDDTSDTHFKTPKDLAKFQVNHHQIFQANADDCLVTDWRCVNEFTN